MITARDYQQRGIDTLFEQHAAGSRGTLLVSPTGSGKTLIAALASDRWIQEGANRKVLIIAHWLAGGLLVLSFLMLVVVYALNRRFKVIQS